MGRQPVVPLLPGDPAELAAHHVDRPAPGQHRQVGAQGPGGGVVPVGMAPQLNEDILGNVLRGGPLAEDPQRGPVNGRPELVEGLGERMIVAGRQAGREQRVRWLHPWDASAVLSRRATRCRCPLRYRIGQPHLTERGGHRSSSAGCPTMATSPRREPDQSCHGRPPPQPWSPAPRPRPPGVTALATGATGHAGNRLLGWFAPPGGKPRAMF